MEMEGNCLRMCTLGDYKGGLTYLYPWLLDILDILYCS